MKVFIAGDYKTGTGPANVTKEYINSFPGKVICQRFTGKALRAVEMVANIALCDIVLFSGYSRQNLLGIKLSGLFKKPTAYLMHGCVEYENGINGVPDETMNSCERATMVGVDRIFAVSERFSEWLKNQYPQFRDKIDWITNGIDAFEACTEGKNSNPKDCENCSNNFKSKEYTIFSIGGGMPRKKIKHICEAVEHLNSEGMNLKLIIVGDTGLDTQVINSYPFVTDLGIVSHDKVKELFKSADLFIQNSCFETFGLAPVEALSLGCSSLFSKEVGALDIIKDARESDIIYRYDDAAEISGKIEFILQNPNAERLFAGIDFDKYSWKERGICLCQKLQEIIEK